MMKKMTNRILLPGVLLVGGLSLLGCDSKPADSASAGEAGAQAASVEPSTVEISAEGTKLDPPVAVAQIPDGAYYCDMGTVHYARMEKGDNKCPLCNMFLTHKRPAGSAAEAAAEHDHDHDHDHDHH